MAKLIILVAFFAFGVSQVYSLYCFTCNSTLSATCANPEDQWEDLDTIDCGSEGLCSKITLRFQVGGFIYTTTERGCVPAGTECSRYHTAEGVKLINCAICDTEYCNRSGKLTGGIFAVLPLIISFLIIKIMT
ncbi:uncharacterized protein LOC129790408 [Lutzomyia longipalpis]|uniref:Putative 13.7 kDa midgut protein n=1 Tax=Lutzomyia longipalpis TaxID=7200 RepID=A0A1B0GLK1_LUTLO|nr:uncharacterized protein LOC129790408 [Lutzomyia longipalpis]